MAINVRGLDVNQLRFNAHAVFVNVCFDPLLCEVRQ